MTADIWSDSNARLGIQAQTCADVTVILNAIEPGTARTKNLLPLVYEELRSLAAAQVRNERAGQTLQATALGHEAFLRLVGDVEATWQN